MKDGKPVITPIEESVDLEALVEGINEQSRYAEITTGFSVGNEF